MLCGSTFLERLRRCWLWVSLNLFTYPYLACTSCVPRFAGRVLHSLPATSLSSCVRSVGVSSALCQLRPAMCFVGWFVVCRWCSASTAWIPYLRQLIAFGRCRPSYFMSRLKYSGWGLRSTRVWRISYLPPVRSLRIAFFIQLPHNQGVTSSL